MELKLILSIIGTVVLTLAIAEFQAWCPKLTKLIKNFAVRRLPCDLRERLDEEWDAYLAELPEGLVKLTTSCGFVVASCRLSTEISYKKIWRNLVRVTCLQVGGRLGRLSGFLAKTANAIRGDQPENSFRSKIGIRLTTFSFGWVWLPALKIVCTSIMYTDCPTCRKRMVNTLRTIKKDLEERLKGDEIDVPHGPWSEQPSTPVRS